MSERELMQADWALRDAHREVTLARLALDDLHRGCRRPRRLSRRLSWLRGV